MPDTGSEPAKRATAAQVAAIATGILAMASGLLMWRAAPDASRVVTVSVQDQAGRAIAAQRLPFRTSGTRYRMRLLAGSYSINAASAGGDSAGDKLHVPANKTIEEEFDDPSLMCVG